MKFIKLIQFNKILKKNIVFLGITLFASFIIINYSSYGVNARQIPDDPQEAILNEKMLKM